MLLTLNKIWRDANKNMRDTSKPGQIYIYFFMKNTKGIVYTSLILGSQGLSSPHHHNIIVIIVRNTNLD